MTRIMLLFAALASACSGELSTEELIAALEKEGIQIEDATKERTQMQREVDNAKHALSTGVPIPKLVRSVRLDGVVSDIFWCPGGTGQAELVVARVLRGERPEDPPYLDVAADDVNGWINLTFESHIISMSPPRPRTPRDELEELQLFPGSAPAKSSKQQKPMDAEVLKIAAALAKIEDR